MTAPGGLDGAGASLLGSRRASWSTGEGAFVDALSGSDGMADPAPWPVEPDGGPGAADEVFPDALSTPDPGRAAGRRGPTPVPDGARAATVVAAVAGPMPRNPSTPAPTAARRAPAPARRAPQQVTRPATAPARRAPQQVTRPATAPARRAPQMPGPAPVRAATRSSTPPTSTRPTSTRPTSTRPTNTWPANTRPTRPARPPATRRTPSGQRRRPGSTLLFVVFVLAVLVLFGSGLATALADLVRSVLDR